MHFMIIPCLLSYVSGAGKKPILRFLFFALIIGVMVPGIIQPCCAAQDVIERFQCGSVNWTLGKIKATGICVSEKLNLKKPINCEIALANAKINAHHNLLEVAKAIHVENDITIGEFAGKDDVIMANLMDMVKQAPVIQQKYLTDGTAEVTVEMTMFGGLSQLVLPIEIQHVESIQPVKTNHKNVPEVQGSDMPSPSNVKKEIYSGLIVDARGLDIKEVMTPKILAENREEVYGPAFVSREIAVQKGLCHYEADISSARNHEKVAGNPLTVKGLRIDPPYNTEIIISNSDALKLKSASEHLMFLKKCQVIIVVDPSADATAPSSSGG